METGKPSYQIMPNSAEERLSAELAAGNISEFFPVPCGKCIGCRLDYSRQWADRCMLEAQQYKDNAFLTLTYDDDHVPHSERGTLNLRSEDLSVFMKRLRARWKDHFNHDGIRFFGCGEYGDDTARPHLHIIAFNLPIPDMVFLYRNFNGDDIFTSPLLKDVWGNGIVGIGEVTWQSAAYVARYVVKKRKGPDAVDFYKEHDLTPEFVRMSRRPGIAYQYYAENGERIYKTDEIFLSLPEGGKKLRPCRYYDRLFDLDHPDVMSSIREQRRERAAAAAQLKAEQTDLLPQQIRDNERRTLERAAEKLVRKFVQTT